MVIPEAGPPDTPLTVTIAVAGPGVDSAVDDKVGGWAESLKILSNTSSLVSGLIIGIACRGRCFFLLILAAGAEDR